MTLSGSVKEQSEAALITFIRIFFSAWLEAEFETINSTREEGGFIAGWPWYLQYLWMFGLGGLTYPGLGLRTWIFCAQ